MIRRVLIGGIKDPEKVIKDVIEERDMKLLECEIEKETGENARSNVGTKVRDNADTNVGCNATDPGGNGGYGGNAPDQNENYSQMLKSYFKLTRKIFTIKKFIYKSGKYKQGSKKYENRMKQLIKTLTQVKNWDHSRYKGLIRRSARIEIKLAIA